MSMPLARHYTADDVRALPDDGNRYETVHGELLVTPSPGPKHQYFLERLADFINAYLVANGQERAFRVPADISFAADTLVQPDIFVADLSVLKQTWSWADIGPLQLAVEVVSPSSVKTDRTTKRRLYQEQLIPEYWVVDVDQQQIEVWTPTASFPRVERERLIWRHPALSVDCIIDMRSLFSLQTR